LFGRVEQDADVVLDHRGARVTERPLQYRGFGRRTHGPRGPFRALRRPTVLTPPDPLRKMGYRVRRPLAAILALFALATPVASAATPAPSTALQRKLARALRVPHVSRARSAALAVDLATGAALYTQNGSRSLA